MSQNYPENESRKTDKKPTLNGKKINTWLVVLSCVLLVLFAASLFWGYSEWNRVKELEDVLSDARLSTPSVGETQSCEELLEPTEEDVEESSDYSRGSETIIENFSAAFESGDYEQVRALFTNDGVLTTASNVHDAIMRGDTSGLADRVDEPEFIRLATLHGSHGQEFIILGNPLMVGENTLAFAWEWGDGVNGTALIHLRDGKIVICILNPSQYQIPYFGE